MKNDIALLMLEDGGSPIQNPSTAVEDARLASLISLDGILKQVKVIYYINVFHFFLSCFCVRNRHLQRCLLKQDIGRQASVNALSRSKKKALLASLDELTEQMPSLLEIDHPCARRQITDSRQIVEVCESFKFLYWIVCTTCFLVVWVSSSAFFSFPFLYLCLNSIWLFSFGNWVK